MASFCMYVKDSGDTPAVSTLHHRGGGGSRREGDIHIFVFGILIYFRNNIILKYVSQAQLRHICSSKAPL